MDFHVSCDQCVRIFYTFSDVDECEKKPCHKYAECTNTDGSFKCKCKEGCWGNGYWCRQKVRPAYALPYGNCVLHIIVATADVITHRPTSAYSI